MANQSNSCYYQIKLYAEKIIIKVRQILCTYLQYFIYFISIMQSGEFINKRGRKPRYQHVLNKTRQANFNNRWSLNEKAKNYEALSDPYTSYYFANKSVKDHLKELKRALKYQPNFTEKSRINKLITIRMKEKFQDVLCPKTSVYQSSLGQNQLKKINQKSKSSFSNKKLDNYLTHKQSNPTPFVLPENPHPKPLTTRKEADKLPRIKHQTVKLARQIEAQQTKIETNSENEKQKAKKATISKPNQQKIIADKLAQELHQKKHDKWISFLEEKKKMFSQKTPTESPRKESLDATPEEPPK